ncbi:MAG: sulfite exporter TauE/SafE family protein [Gammaproteobacteria bacterium]|nr:sulfite exporter TauE/SafE family protein [Gammaproteobacteria bacterium]
MTPETLWILTAAVFAVAILYSSVGHAGASGYLAVMALLSLAPAEIKPIALALNILVASIGTWQFWRAGHFSWSLFWPFALLSVPFAFAGGYLNLPSHLFKILVGIVLLLSAAQFLLRPPAESEPHQPPKLVALGAGGLLGLMSGLTGTGGGIFLTPLLIFMRWARTRTAAAVSAPFILLNSASGLAGNISATRNFPDFAWALVIAAVIGGTIGSYFGSRRLPQMTIKRLLAIVLTIAGFKLILT